MALKLANNEQIVKSWSVSASTNSKKLKDVAFCDTLNLTVTNKRLVLQNETENSLKRNEILLKDVSGVSVSRNESTTVKGYSFFLSFGMMLLLIGLALILVKNLPTVLGIILMVFGVIMFFIRIKKNYISFALKIYTKALSANIVDFSVGFVPTTKQPTAPAVFYFVNKEEVYDIADTIGSLVVDKN